jgi:6-phosphogluconate dehydrogenase
MDIGFVGLRDDRAARRLARAGVRVFGCDPEGRAQALAAESVLFAMPDAVALAKALTPPRVAWLDLPTGFATELAIQDVWPELAPGDAIVDAGEGVAADGIRRAASLASARIQFVDCRVRREDGHVFVGGDDAAIGVIAPYLAIIAGDAGWTHSGPAGAGYHSRMGDPA